MEKAMTTAYISLGSNMGDRLWYLQAAADEMGRECGRIFAVSKVYQTPAWGFRGADFYNACLGLRTLLSAEDLLKKLLETERKLGRIRSEETGYRERTIDLDILFFGNETIHTETLSIPHPRVHQRKFVLQPLSDIAKKYRHPQLGVSIRELLEACEDSSQLRPLELQLLFSNSLFRDIRFIAIEGNIGAGKTTLASRMARDFNAKLVLEQFADNPFLPSFYEDPDRYAFPLEMSFLAERYQQFTQDTRMPDLFRSLMVSDYDIYKSLIFAGVTLGEEEFRLYRRLFGFMYKNVLKPDLYVFLHQHTDRLMENIRNRGREYEQQIPVSYLESINKAYLEYIKTQPGNRTLVLDISELDFVANEDDYHTVIEAIAGVVEKST